MAKKFNQPLRMCVSCRKKDAQSKLQRLQCKDSQLMKFEGTGRSFYLCQICLKDEKKVLKSLMHQCRSGDRDKFSNTLKEIITDDRKS